MLTVGQLFLTSSYIKLNPILSSSTMQKWPHDDDLKKKKKKKNWKKKWPTKLELKLVPKTEARTLPLTDSVLIPGLGSLMSHSFLTNPFNVFFFFNLCSKVSVQPTDRNIFIYLVTYVIFFVYIDQTLHCSVLANIGNLISANMAFISALCLN